MLKSSEHEIVIVGILTCISIKNVTSESLKAKKSIFQHFSFKDQLTFHAQ